MSSTKDGFTVMCKILIINVRSVCKYFMNPDAEKNTAHKKTGNLLDLPVCK